GTAEIGSIWMQRMEATLAAWQRCETEGVCRPRTLNGFCARAVRRTDIPVDCIDYAEASDFCRWLGGRIPTAEEWEFAAKSGGDSIYPWGNDPVAPVRASFASLRGIEPADSHHAGDTQWGLVNMAGNVWEWTSSDYDTQRKEIRGGAWSTGPDRLRNSN